MTLQVPGGHSFSIISSTSGQTSRVSSNTISSFLKTLKTQLVHFTQAIPFSLNIDQSDRGRKEVKNLLRKGFWRKPTRISQ